MRDYTKYPPTMSRDEIREKRQAHARYIRRKNGIRNVKIASVVSVLILLMYGLTSCFAESDKETLSEESKQETTEMDEQKYVYGLDDEINPVPKPDMEIDHLPINEFSRPGQLVNSIDNVVIHYVGNPNTTAEQNRSYYEQIIATMEASVSSNYLVGLEGKIIECVPSYEVAYASNSKNRYSVSIEVSHPDETGEFTSETYESVVALAAWLCGRYELTSEALIRHYDITGKECPKYFVDNPEKWELFKLDVQEILDVYILRNKSEEIS